MLFTVEYKEDMFTWKCIKKKKKKHKGNEFHSDIFDRIQ